jgi:hypothetical protein
VRGIFTDDLPLKVLALVLAVTTWAMTRERLTGPETFEDVLVDPLDPPRGIAIREVHPDRVAVTVVGTRAELEQVRAGFERKGRRIGVRLPPVDPAALEGTTDPILDTRAFDFPFERVDPVASVRPAPKIAWTRIEEKTVPLARPALVLPQDANVEPAGGYTTDVTQVTVRGPARLVRTITTVTPDDVDPREWLATKPDLAAPWTTTLGFDKWRGDDPLKGPAMLQIEPRQVKVSVKYKQTGVRALTHALDLSIAADALGTMAGWDVVVTGREYDPVTQRIALPVRADKRTLDEMEQDPSWWSFAVRVPPPPGPGEPAVENRRVPVVLTFTPTTGVARGTAVPATLDGSPSVFVSLRKH